MKTIPFSSLLPQHVVFLFQENLNLSGLKDMSKETCVVLETHSLKHVLFRSGLN